ncbi:MAG: type II toxin-antitoxin system VapC family toxin [Acidobacteriia bacterium]|nr:type II toxin-antitoxin system VapC family toxin [Terriglobia bacterium]
MDCLADTNVLVRSIDRLHPHHPIALGALEHILSNGGRVYIGAQNLIEFWYVCTRPVTRNGLGLAPSEAEKEIGQLEMLLLLLPEVPAIFPEWRRIVTSHAVTGIDVFDARLVAVMHIYGLTDLLTFNGEDFRRYSGISVVEPSTVR